MSHPCPLSHVHSGGKLFTNYLGATANAGLSTAAITALANKLLKNDLKMGVAFGLTIGILDQTIGLVDHQISQNDKKVHCSYVHGIIRLALLVFAGYGMRYCMTLRGYQISLITPALSVVSLTASHSLGYYLQNRED